MMPRLTRDRRSTRTTHCQRRVPGPAAVLAPGLVAGLVAGVLLAACGGSEPDGGSAGAGTPSPTVTTTAAAPGADPAYDEVEFAAPDGELRSGRWYGEGEVAVVLSHMGRRGDGPDDWAAFAEELADQGYQALTYPRRDADSEGWRDVLGAVDHLREHGAERVIAAGASLGAMATLRAVQEPAPEVDGLIWLAGVLDNSGYRFEESDVSSIGCPMLLISGDRDSYGAAEDTRQLHEWATAPSELVMLESRRHGTDMFLDRDENPAELTRAMLDFVDDLAGGSPDPC